MGILDVAKINLPPLETLPEGEAQLVINSAKDRGINGGEPFKSGRTGWSLSFKSDQHPNAETVFENLLMPVDGDSASTERMFVEKIQAFVAAFNITSEDVESWVGKTGWVNVGVEAKDDGSGDRNIIKSYVLPNK